MTDTTGTPGRPAAPAPAPPRPVPPAGATPGQLVRWLFGVLNTRDAQAMRQVLTEETLERFPTGTYRGDEAIAEWFAGLFAALPDITMTIVGMAEQDEAVFVRWRLTGTHTGADFEGIAASGARVDLDGVDHFTVREGRVVSNFVVFDQMQFARQLGLLPRDGSRADVGLKYAFNALTRWRHRG